MRSSWRLVVAAMLVLFVPLGCPRPHAAANHRAVAGTCGTYRPPGAQGGGWGGTTCTADSDCDAGAEGRCNTVPRSPLSPVDECTYDACFTDNDCGAGFACLCWTDYGGDVTLGNQCISAGCRVDADCSAGFQCSLSLAPSCGPPRYACHTSQDECVDTSDCSQPGANGTVACAFTGTRWACLSCGPDA